MIDEELEKIFKAEDFGSGLTGSYASKRARELLKEYAEKNWLVVSGEINRAFDTEKLDNDTHYARLAFVTEIKKEPCKHEPEKDTYGAIIFPVFCCHCEKKLKLPDTWQEE